MESTPITTAATTVVPLTETQTFEQQRIGGFLRNHVYLARDASKPVPPLAVKQLGPATHPNIYQPKGVSRDGMTTLMSPTYSNGTLVTAPEYAEIAGPISHLYFDPEKSTAGIVTCGGLCPGLNNVIRALVFSLRYGYHVPRVLGFKFGYEGITPKHEPIELTNELVKDIHMSGGSILGSSRGEQDCKVVVDTLVKFKVDMLFTIGGDGTLKGAHAIQQEIERRGLPIAVVGIPKTIDNDITYVDYTFGFQTAVSQAMVPITAIHEEARSAINGIGIVKLMGRDAGFIALHAALSNGDVNVVLLPEVKFDLQTLLEHVESRIRRRAHCVIVVAEGAGQHLFEGLPDEFDKSGNRLQKDIGRFLAIKIGEHMKKKGIEHTVKYVDPSYTIRAAVAIPSDALLCISLASNAVHAALAGRTDVVMCCHHNTYIHVPIARAIHYIKRVNPDGPLYRTCIDLTGMPDLEHPPKKQ